MGDFFFFRVKSEFVRSEKPGLKSGGLHHATWSGADHIICQTTILDIELLAYVSGRIESSAFIEKKFWVRTVRIY